ncbi:MAG TPA: OmpA family protein [Rhodospirillaceae bacterium]|nr:OmpA family protein [Rhodospirillaceae bacterium]
MRMFPAILAAGLIAGATTAAMAETNGPYVGAETGITFAPKVSFKDGPRSWRDTQDPGFALLGQLGYGFGQIRVEGEFGWRTNGIDKVSGLTTASGSGSLDAASIMANVYYDFATGTRLTPYLGAGIGGVDVSADNIRGSGVTYSNDDQFTFGYQGIAGVSYALDDNLSIKADYRYLRTADTKLNESPGWGTGSGKGDYSSHSLLVGFTYKFGAPEKPMPAPAPAVAAPPPPAPAKPAQAAPIAKTFMVFFDFDKALITPEAQRIITEAAAQAKGTNATAIHLTGHTDAAGTKEYNMALSLRRAEAVKAALIKLGLPSGEISLVGKGKSELLVPTKDGVREPQNRRVQIVLE